MNTQVPLILWLPIYKVVKLFVSLQITVFQNGEPNMDGGIYINSE